MTAASARHVLVAVLGFGDALISLQLLRRLQPGLAPLEVAGTGVSAAVVRDVLRWPELVHHELLPGHAAYFRARSAPWGEILADLRAFRRWSQANLAPGDTVIFEKPDPRNRLALGRAARRVRQASPARTDSIYADRARLFAALAGGALALPPCEKPGRIATVLVNPSARHAYKQLGVAETAALCRALAELGLQVTLLDPQGTHAGLRHAVARYGEPMPLRAAAELLQAHDAYVGPDSLFVHLAYHFRRPYFLAGPSVDPYFMPPGTRAAGHWALTAELPDAAAWRRRLETFLRG